VAISSPSACGLALFGLAVLGAPLPSEAAGQGCDQATKEQEQAQKLLSKATREADTQAAAYVKCMEGGGSCAGQKAAYSTATAAKDKALASFKSAASKRKTACN
jgi:hypothetical protein